VAPPTQIQDLPHFLVSSVKQGERHAATGRTTFKIRGTFDKSSGVREGRCWLLLPERDCLIGDLESLDPESGTGVFIYYEEPRQDLVGAKLPYVDGYWQAYHVWMVAEPSWAWSKARLQGNQVLAEVFEAKESQTFEGQEVKTWIRVKEYADGSKERLYPVLSGDPQKEMEKILASGWDHEHCELCRSSIQVGDYGFNDLSGHWVCEGCYEKYVATHDLSFLCS